jgi:hypothetical protein
MASRPSERPSCSRRTTSTHAMDTELRDPTNVLDDLVLASTNEPDNDAGRTLAP